MTFSWAAFEYEPGKIEYINYDNYLLDAARHGISVMPVLFDPPAWRERRPGGRTPLPRPQRRDGSLGRAARRALRPERDALAIPPGGHAAAGYGMADLERADASPVYWRPKPNVEQYMSMLRTVGAAIKARDPNAEIVTAGLPPSFLSGAIRLKQLHQAALQGRRAAARSTRSRSTLRDDARGLGKLIGRFARS